MNKQIVKGDEMMLFKGIESIAYATSHTLTITGNAIDIATKDHGYWGAKEVGNLTWEASSENLFTEDAYADLFDAMVNREKITVTFGVALNYDPNGIVNNSNTPVDWKLCPDRIYYQGRAYITSLTANANTGENATFSVTLSGCGALKRFDINPPA